MLDLLYGIELGKRLQSAPLREPRPPLGIGMMAMQFLFERSERLAPEALQRQQLRQLDLLLRHAVREVPYYREVFGRVGYDSDCPLTLDLWRRLPILTREILQARRDDLRAAAYPPEHGRTVEGQSSGSTGMPISAAITELCKFLWEAITLRDHLWHGRDFTGSLAVFRRHQVEGSTRDGVVSSIWNHGVSAAFHTGPGRLFDGVRTTEERIDWLLRVQPDYLLTPPSMLRELLRTMDRRPMHFDRLKGISTFAEQVPDGLREETVARLGVKLKDLYSCREIGYIALECPDHPHYHVQSEAVMVEIVDDDGRVCGPGEVGRVVVTSLHNFAMPLIRYALGDYAEAGPPCPCGRGLPVLRRILGRTRNMLRLPDGDGKWIFMHPLEKRIRDLPVKQYQLVQRALGEIEVRIVPAQTLTPAEEDVIRATILGPCGAEGCRVTIEYVEAIPRSEGGKYEDFMCELA
ncbi:MAG TPA: phenylacetate--CoA ligase family protein [Alphaproteobacteria bacterium]|jgi:phenylacetate-CoA ligase